MRFIHTADLHIGMRPDRTRPWGSARADAVAHSLSRFVSLCNEQEIDLLLIAGDLFHRPPTEALIKDADYLFSALTHTRVVIIAGNHDFIRPGCAMAAHVFPENVTLITSPEEEVVSFPQWNLCVHGLSFDAAIQPENRLANLAPPADGRRHILLAHGGDAQHQPFLPAALAEQGWDYVALGHIHKPSISADGRVAMPGSPEPLDLTETGPHGYYLGSLSANGSFSLSWKAFSHFEYADIEVNVTPELTQSALESLLRRRLKTDGSEVCRILLSGRRSPEFSFDREALLRLGPVCDVVDETKPDYPWEEWRERPSYNLLARVMAALSPGEDDPDAARKGKALDYCADALLSTGRKTGEEVLR